MRPATILFARRLFSLLELSAAVLAVWAALYHTPVGALARSLGDWATGSRASRSQPLLAYYSSGVYGSQRAAAVAPPPAFLAGASATGQGFWAVYSQLDEAARSEIAEHGRALGAKVNTKPTPEQVAEWVEKASSALGSEDAGVLSLFCGESSARYALDRVRAEAKPRVLEELQLQLPPGLEDAVGRASQALMLGRAYTLSWPVDEATPITSPFGLRRHPVLGGMRLHTGVDLGLPVGTPVFATAPGLVRRASEDAVNGRVLVIDHGRGVTTAYRHNSHLEVEIGQEVSGGQLIAHSGNTGRSTGPHLHYQLELGRQPTDPLSLRKPLQGRRSRQPDVLHDSGHESERPPPATEL